MINIRRNIGFLILIFILVLLATSKPAEPQIFKDVLKEVTDKIPTLDSFLEQKPAITTSLKDAVTEVPFLDDFNPKDISLMTWLPRGSGGKFKLTHAGVFKFKSQSYCLHAGTYAPTKGDGYLYAPIMGPRAEIIKAILERTWNRPEISQQTIQALIWAILAHTKISDMRGETLSLAMSILTEKEIFELNGGALGILSDELMQKAMDKLSPAMRPIFEAESKIRSLLTVPGTTYSDLERVAVLVGEPVRGKDSRDIPSGRWSYHPKGYFIRYFPHGYPTTDIQVSVPHAFSIKKDEKGRIVSVINDYGYSLELTYDDSITPIKPSGDSDVSFYAIKSIKYEYRTSNHPEYNFSQTKEWNDKGWTILGSPNGKGRFDNIPSRFNQPDKRYETLLNHKKELERLIDNAVKLRGKDAKKGGEKYRIDALDIASLSFALRDIGGNVSDNLMRISAVEFLQRAWQYYVVLSTGITPIAGNIASSDFFNVESSKSLMIASLLDDSNYICDLANPSLFLAGLSSGQILALNPGEGDGGAGLDGHEELDLCDGVACPGNTSCQRLKPSGREQDDPDKDKEPCQEGVDALKNALRWLEAYNDPDVLKNSKDVYDYIRNVEKKAQENYKNETGGEGQVSSEASVGSDCQLYIDNKPATFDDFRKWLRNAYPGMPPEVIEALVKHEETHIKQCFKSPTFGKPSKEELSKNEIEAYCVEASIIMDYLTSKCDGVPPDLQNKFNRFCGG